MKLLVIAAFTVAVSVGATAARAQTVWRCGNSYSQQPCLGGATLDPGDRRTPAEAAQAASAAQADAKRADAMEQARLEQERKAPPAVVPGLAAASQPQAKAKSAGKHGKKARPSPKQAAGDFTAVGPAPARRK